MRKISLVLIVLGSFVVGIGFYRGWFALSSPSTPEGSNAVSVNLTTDPDKMKEDAEALKDKAGELKDKAGELTGNADDDSAEPAERPTDEPAERPTDVPAERPTDVPAERPTDVPAERPTDEVQTNQVPPNDS